MFTVLVDNNMASYSILFTNVSGELIKKKVVTSDKLEFDNQLATGICIIILFNENKTITTKKLLKTVKVYD
ncbi:MAG: hypothetical protein H7141_02715 [Burkholderiales bacterium]|nr:hypothetical protein [Bacteroidia bacterium]